MPATSPKEKSSLFLLAAVNAIITAAATGRARVEKSYSAGKYQLLKSPDFTQSGGPRVVPEGGHILVGAGVAQGTG